MNKLFRKLTSLKVTSPKPVKKVYPFTLAFNDLHECIDSKIGKVTDFSQFPAGTVVLNICHRNGRSTVVKKN